MGKELEVDGGILVAMEPMCYWKCKRTGESFHGAGPSLEADPPFRVTQKEYDIFGPDSERAKASGARPLFRKVSI